MKYLKSYNSDLRILFEQSITVRYIAEHLASFDSEISAEMVLEFMHDNDFDVIGVRKNGLICGYVNKSDLCTGKLCNYLVEFDPRTVLDEKTSLVETFQVLGKSQRAFILIFGKIGGIVTRGDMQKAPVRMWLFGLISLLEMQMLRLIREFCPNDEWISQISPNRLGRTKKILADRCKRNLEIDLVDCLQFCDKSQIIMSNEALRTKSGFKSRTEGDEVMKSLEILRNELAHSQDIITGNWPDIVILAEKAEKVLKNLERIEK